MKQRQYCVVNIDAMYVVTLAMNHVATCYLLLRHLAEDPTFLAFMKGHNGGNADPATAV